MVFGKLLQALKKTRDALTAGLARLFQGRQLDDAFLDDLEEVLYNGDLGPVGTRVVDELKAAYKRRDVREMAEVPGFLRQRLTAMLAGSEAPLAVAPSGPTIVMIVGVNGAGKTTSIAKLARHLQRQGKTVLLGAGDTFRAAAVEQLTLWADRLGIPIVKQATGADPAAVAFDAVGAALARKVDYLLLDTAGRLHTQKNLMAELEKIVRVVKKQAPDAPHETLLVLDATSGQNAVAQAAAFKAACDVTGIFLAKLDGTAKGGIVVAIRDAIDVPVKLVGVGETPDDVEAFDPDAFVEAMFAA
jgi:fused signal recognition particle receptor